jgi:Predicted membrane protein
MKDVPHLVFAGMLSAVAGYIDAAGYLHFSSLFLSFMSGNSATVGIDVGLGRWAAAAVPSLAILAFLAGSSLGALVEALAGPRRVTVLLAIEAGLIGLALGWSRPGEASIAAWFPIAVAMGAHNATLRHVDSHAIGLTYVTGTLAKLGQSVVDAFLGRTGRSEWILYALMWFGLAFGAVGGAAACRALGYQPALLSAAAALALLSLFSLRQQRAISRLQDGRHIRQKSTGCDGFGNVVSPSASSRSISTRRQMESSGRSLGSKPNGSSISSPIASNPKNV